MHRRSAGVGSGTLGVFANGVRTQLDRLVSEDVHCTWEDGWEGFPEMDVTTGQVWWVLRFTKCLS
jgi:hypothetical protein